MIYHQNVKTYIRATILNVYAITTKCKTVNIQYQSYKYIFFLVFRTYNQ